MEDSKDTPGCGCSAAGMLFSATQRTPLWLLLGPLAVETHPYILLQTAWVHPRGQRAPGPGKFSVPVCPSHTGRSEQCGPSQLRATGDAARRETGCYGNLRRMEPGTAVTLNPAPCLLRQWQSGPGIWLFPLLQLGTGSCPSVTLLGLLALDAYLLLPDRREPTTQSPESTTFVCFLSD